MGVGGELLLVIDIAVVVLLSLRIARKMLQIDPPNSNDRILERATLELWYQNERCAIASGC